jgi:hypothetical protein
MTTKFSISAIDRRQFLSTTAAAALMAGVSMPKIAFAADKVVKIGFLAPLTGAVAAWGSRGSTACTSGPIGSMAQAASRLAATTTRSSSSRMTMNTTPARRAPAP